jgi:hypothetical protein
MSESDQPLDAGADYCVTGTGTDLGNGYQVILPGVNAAALGSADVVLGAGG